MPRRGKNSEHVIAVKVTFECALWAKSSSFVSVNQRYVLSTLTHLSEMYDI